MHINYIILNIPRVDVLVDCCIDDKVVICVLIWLFCHLLLLISLIFDMVHVNC